MRTTWRLVLEYDGRRFSGFQRQSGQRTIQQTLEEALTQFFGGERIVVHGSGRTDAGVHALGQVVSFRATPPRDAERVRLAMNTMLPNDLSVIEAAVAPPRFHARKSACGKTYRYVVLGRPDRSPFHTGKAWYMRYPVDWAKVEATLEILKGMHDFSAFRAAACENPRPIRSVDHAEHVAHGDLHHLEFAGKGFLRYQVRIMTGTAIDVGVGKRTLDDVRRALETGQRDHAGRTAPPDGLYLVEVRYPEAALRFDGTTEADADDDMAPDEED